MRSPGNGSSAPRPARRGRVEDEFIDIIGYRKAQVDRIISFVRGLFSPVLTAPQSASDRTLRTYRDTKSGNMPRLILLVLRTFPAKNRRIRQWGLSTEIRDKADLVGVCVGSASAAGVVE
jgi:hypothetical protein